MKKAEDQDVEGLLRSTRLKPARPGLREKVLDAAAKHKEETAWTTPLLRWCLAGCAVVLAVIFVMDAGLSRRQQERLRSVFNGYRGSQSNFAKEGQALIKDLNDFFGSKQPPLERWALAHQREANGNRRSAFIGEFFREDHNGSEIAKDLD
jgi:hypothetical protein